MSPAVLPPSTARCEEMDTLYSLFFNGLVDSIFMDSIIAHRLMAVNPCLKKYFSRQNAPCPGMKPPYGASV